MSRQLEARITRLECKECCLSSFHEYLHFLDAGLVDDLLQVFAPDAELHVINFPPGSGKDLHFSGVDEIKQIYSGNPPGMGRHHSGNVTVNVTMDSGNAELSAYFIASGAFGLGGGLYQATMKPGMLRWQFQQLHIVSTWGWVVPTEAEPYLSEQLGTGALREGRPVRFSRT